MVDKIHLFMGSFKKWFQYTQLNYCKQWMLEKHDAKNAWWSNWVYFYIKYIYLWYCFNIALVKVKNSICNLQMKSSV